MGWQIVSHSFVLLFRNLGDALKVSVGPYLIGLAIAFGVAMALGAPFGVITGTTDWQTTIRLNEDGPGLFFGALFGVLLMFAVLLFVSGWVAVSWHRFVLLEEYPGIIPSPSGKPIGGYVWRLILLVLVLVLLSIPIGFVFGLVTTPFLASGPGAGLQTFALIFGIALGAILSWLWLRLALTLPAVAVGNPIGMGDSWSTTARLSGAIFQAGLILMVINGVASYVVGMIFGATIIGQVLNLIVTWISLMIGISILTTLYGHLVEGRDID